METQVKVWVLLYKLQQKQKDLFGASKWWERKKINFMAMAMVVAPSLIVSTTVPDAFSAATDICVSTGV